MQRIPKLQPSAIDERIRKACQVPKLNSFWKYLLPGTGGVKTLHPGYVCWYNSCENLGDWTFSAGVDASIDTADYKENVGSLLIDVPADSTGYQFARLKNGIFNWCDKYLG